MTNPSLLTLLKRGVRLAGELIIAAVVLVPLIIAALVSRLTARRGIGLGPEPLINNVHHARALKKAGYDALTFVSHEYYITSQFDLRWLRGRPFNHYGLFLKVLFSFEAIYIYFNGGPLSWTLLRPFEPWLYRVAGVKVVVMPYGGDVQDFAVFDDVVYRAAYLADYPNFVRRAMGSRRSNVARWCRHADHIIAGCDWVRYLPYWDTLMLAHFSIDTELWAPRLPAREPAAITSRAPLRVLHAPNHRTIKGTSLVEAAIGRLRGEGVPIELVIIEKMRNEQLRRLVQEVDVVVEQLVIGWYGMFALEAMACAKPVLTYIADDLERLYVHQGLLRVDELPVLKVDYRTLEPTLRSLAGGKIDLRPLGEASRDYVQRRHSLAAVGRVFSEVNMKIGLRPTMADTQ